MDKINLLLYVAHVIDPRTKLKALQYYLVKCSGPEWAKQIETNVKDLLNHLWERYSKLCGGGFVSLGCGCGKFISSFSQIAPCVMRWPSTKC
jgi:hypothetical protein